MASNEANPEASQCGDFSVPEESAGERLDAFLVRHFPKHSRVKLQRAIAAGKVTVDGNNAKSSTRLNEGQSVCCDPFEEEVEGPIPEEISLDIIFEDESLVAINKPPAMVVHPAKGHWAGTLTSALAFHFQQLSSVGGPTRPGIVHRLDRDTSGVILVAKTDTAHVALAAQFEARTVAKEYLAIVTPAPGLDRDIIDRPIGAHPFQREKKAIRDNHQTSRNAISRYEVTERFDGFAVVAVHPKTGRTHQIRVHLDHSGFPVLCDRLYSGRARITVGELQRRRKDETVLLQRQALHARSISFTHPVSGESMTLVADLPADISRTIEALRKYRPL